MSATMIGVIGGLLILLAVGVLVWAGLAQRRSNARYAEAANERAPEHSPLGVGNLPNVDTGYDEEEMPTVVVSRPSKPTTPRAAAPPRSSGATIIAFDDEDDEED